MLQRSLSLISLTLAGAALTVVPAQAHIQVLPTEVAPSDPVLFTVMVPGEESTGTTKVILKVPPGIYPFSFEKAFGWNRRLVKKKNGLIDQIVWSGRAEPDGLVRFSFLAGTPAEPGEIRWAAIQAYRGGKEVRWIGDPNSDHPAPVTVVSESAARLNAGGESAAVEPTAASSAEAEKEDETNWPLTVTALLGFFFGLSSLVILLLKRQPKAGIKG